MISTRKIGFRTKLIVGCFIIEATILCLLIASNLKSMETTLQEQFNTRIDEIGLLLNASLVAPIVSRDFARMQVILTNIREDERISYLVLKDDLNRTMASSGWPQDQKMPTPDPLPFVLSADTKETLHLQLPIYAHQQFVADLHIGLPMKFFFEAKKQLLDSGIAIAVVGIFSTLLLIMTMGVMLTRRITRLAEASDSLAKGNLGIRVQDETMDEIGRLAQSFNLMASSLKDKIKALALAKEESQRYLDVAAVMIVALDSHGNVTLINKKGCEILGRDEKTILGKNWFDTFIPEENRPEVKNVFEKLIKGEAAPVRYFENIVLCRDGMQRLLAWHNNYIRNSAGDIIGTIGSCEDITERRRGEESLKKTHEKLEEMVLERTMELQKTHSQLLHAEKLSAIGRLSASIAHEFNNPLQGVMTVIKGLKKRLCLEKDTAELVDLAITECERMKHLIIDLQDFNRPTSGRMALMDVHSAIDGLLLLCKKDFWTKNLTVEKKYCQSLPRLLAVVDQIKQVFLNLLNNAADACEDGGRIEIITEVDQDDIVVRFRDDGKGVKFEDIDRIFEPFYTTKPAVKGTGLGLSVSYGIVKKHGGKIEVESGSGKGAMLSVFLPIKGINDQQTDAAKEHLSK